MRHLARKRSHELTGLRGILGGHIVKRSRTISTITHTMGEKEMKLGSPTEPVNSFLFLKPAKIKGARLSGTLTRTMFKDRRTVVHMSVSRCVRGRDISGVVKSPPKCMNCRRNKRLDRGIHEGPCDIVLFSRVRGTRPSIFGVLLRMLSSNRVASTRNEGISFGRAVVVVASGTNTRVVVRPGRLKFVSKSARGHSCRQVGSKIVRRIQQVFGPRFLGQVSRVVMFRSLGGRGVEGVIAVLLGGLRGHYRRRLSVVLGIAKTTGSLVTSTNFSDGCNTEPLHHTVRAGVRSRVTARVLRNQVGTNSAMRIGIGSGGVCFRMGSTRGTWRFCCFL